MRQFVLTLAGTLILTATFAATARPAAASSPGDSDYRTAMRTFVKELDNYADTVTVAADAAVVKPELACGEDLAELAQIGKWMTADLEGTSRLAPAHLALVHDQLTASVAAFAEQAEAACYSAPAAASSIHAERPGFDRALMLIEFHARFGGGGA